MVKLIGNLDHVDVDSILHIFVEINHYVNKLKELITGELEGKFPTTMDHFQNFDLPYLRGTLAQIDPVLRLTAYAENTTILREQAASSTSPVPAAVVDIIGSYLPV